MHESAATFDTLWPADPGRRPAMLAIAGDSAAGKTTVSRGLVEALGHASAAAICVDDYHRYDREERKGLPFTPLHPECNYMDVMEQHLALLARGQPVLKPVYDHATGRLTRPEPVEPRPYLVVEGLLPLHPPAARACFDATVYLDPAEDVRRRWKQERDTTARGYTAEQVDAELRRREPEAEAFVRPQKAVADIVVRFDPAAGGGGGAGSLLALTLILAPTIPQPGLVQILGEAQDGGLRLELARDDNGRPVEALRVAPDVPAVVARRVAEAVWADLGVDAPLPDSLGRVGGGGGGGGVERSEPLALAQLVLLYHLVRARTAVPATP